MAARRSRTGCATCRKRKLKCDEARPVCGQCTKSRRDCVPSEGVAFRHEQNAGLNSNPDDGDRSLGNFFKYRNQFTEEQKKSFLPTQFPLEWRLVTDPWADEAEQNAPRPTSSPQAYQQQVASHSLEALSTAATENNPYQPPVTYADLNGLYPGNKGGYGPAGGPMQGPNQNNNINFLLNPSSTPAAMIDPNLDVTDLEDMKVIAEGSEEVGATAKEAEYEDKDEEAPENVADENEVAELLRNYRAQKT